MADSILEQISQNIETTLAKVAIANSNTGRLYVVRQSNQSLTLQNGLCVVEELEPEEQTPPLGHKQWVQPYSVKVYVQQSSRAKTSIRARLNNLAADIHKQLKVDRTRGSVAINTTIDAMSYTVDGEFDRIDMTIGVQYRTLIGNPFSQ